MPLATRPPNKPASVALTADAEVVEIRRPIVTGKRVRLQPFDQRRLQSLLLQVAQGDVVQRIGRLAVMQVGQEANTALVVGTAEPGEGRAADDGDVAILALVTRAGIVDRDRRTDCQASLEQAGLLGREGVLTRRQQRVDLADGEVEAPFAQLLMQLRLRDVAVVVLVQNEPSSLSDLRFRKPPNFTMRNERAGFSRLCGLLDGFLLVFPTVGAIWPCASGSTPGRPASTRP